MRLKSRAIRSVVGFGSVQTFRYSFSFVLQIVFARLLSPDAFGVVTFAVTLMMIAGVLGNWGVNEAIMQEVEIDSRFSTIFWIRLLFVCVLTGGIILLSPVVGLFYKRIVVEALLVFALSKGALTAVGPLSGAVIREFKLTRYALIQFITLIGGAFVGLWSILILELTTWGLVFFYATQDVLTAALILVISPQYPSFAFNPEAARWFAGFAKGMWVSKVTGLAENRLDDYLVGTLSGTVTLGVYNIAWRLTNAYTTVFQTAISQGILPTFSRLRGQEEDSLKGMEFLLRVQLYVVVPLYLFVSIRAETIIVLTFGPQWADAGPILAVLSLAGILFPLVNTVRQYYYSINSTTIIVRVNSLVLVLMLVFVTAGIKLEGAVGAAFALNIVEFSALAVFVYGLRNDLGLSVRRTFQPALLAGSITLATIGGATYLNFGRQLNGIITGDISLPLQFLSLSAAGIGVAGVFYCSLYLLIRSQLVKDSRVILIALFGEAGE